jgi:hypothetical protein
VEPIIAVAGRMKKGEGSGKQTAPLGEEEKFRNDFSAQQDQKEEVKEDIEDRLRQGTISEERAQVLKDELEARHRDWARRNRQDLDRYFPGYCDSIIPQVNLVRVIISASHVTWVHESELLADHEMCECTTF